MTDRFATAESTGAIRRWRPPAIVRLAALAALWALTAAPPADAAEKKARPAPARPAQPTETTAPREAGETIMAIVSIKSQKVTVYDADGWILQRTGVDRDQRTRNAGRRLRRGAEEQGPPLEYV